MQREPWHIEILGGLRACRGGQPPLEMSRQQTGALLAYLALSLNRSQTREELMAVIWPEDLPEVARHKLRQSLYALRRLVDPSPSETDPVLLTTRTTVQLNPRLVTTDAARFEQKLQDALHTTDLPERIGLLTTALSHYRGELLPGLYQEEFLTERSRLAELHRIALQRLMRAYECAGDLNHAIETGWRALALDPLMEEIHCDLMRLYAAAGQPSAVMRQYQELVDTLKAAMGKEPSHSTRLLMESLHETARANAAPIETGVPSPPTISEEEDAPDVPVADLPVSDASAPIDTLSTHPRRFQPRLARFQPVMVVAVAALCLLLALQTLGRRAVVSAVVIPSTRIAPRKAVDPGSIPASRSKGTTASFTIMPQPHRQDRGATLARRAPRTLPPSVAVVHDATTHRDVLTVRSTPDPGSGSRPNRPEPGVKRALLSEQPDQPTAGVPVNSVVWMKSYEPQVGDKTSEATAVTTDVGDNIYVTGFVDTEAHDADFLTLKYDDHGNLLWERRYNGPGNDVDRARAIAVDHQGNVYVTGESDNGKGNGTTRLAGTDFATIKYGPDGKPSPTWPDVGFGVGVRRYNGPADGEDRPVRLLVDASGVYVLGRSWGRGKTGKDGFQYALVKYSPDGSEQWTYRYDGGHGDDEPVDMALDPDGSLYVTGQSRAEPATGPELDMLTLKISKEGKRIWEQRQGANSRADGHAVAIGLDGGGNVIVVGEGRGAAGTPDAARLGCIVVKYDPKGTLQWARGTVEEKDRIDTVITAHIGIAGEVVVAGVARDARAVPVIRTVLRNSDGLPLWAADYGQLCGIDGPSEVTLDSEGALLCGGICRFDHNLGLFALRYSFFGKRVWQHYLGAPYGRSLARAMISNHNSPIVVGQVNDGKPPQWVVIKYQP